MKALVIYFTLFAVAMAAYTVYLQNEVFVYKTRAETIEMAYNRLQKLTPIKDASNYPFVGKVTK